jgi:cytochrome c oxidase subunit 2
MAFTLARRLAVVAAAGAVALALPALAHPTIDVVASNWKFTPATVELHVGETTTLHLTSSAGVHGIQSDELGIPQTMIAPGKFVDVEITPKKAGTYKVSCSIVCGAGHGDMVLTIEVKP